MNMLALTVFVLTGMPTLKSGQRVTWSFSKKALKEFDPNEWEVLSWEDPANGSLVFELREKIEAFGLPKSALRQLGGGEKIA